MGICKCRKKTLLFCWHCTKAVCLDCITEEEHKLAYVNNYELWLSNPESPPPVCPLTNNILTAGDEVIRFMNLKIFLLSAIDDYGKSKPANTALAGFTIPGTNEPMVPPPEEKSKLAQQIRQKLSRFPWISSMIALQAEIMPEKPISRQYSDPIARPEGYALDKSKKLNEVDSHYTSDPLFTGAHKVVGTVPKKISRSTGGISETDVHIAKGAPYTPTRLREEDGEDKYKRRPLEMDALFGSTRTGVLAQSYQMTGKRLLLAVALVVTLVVVIFLSMNLDDDTTVPHYEETLQELAQNGTKQQDS